VLTAKEQIWLACREKTCCYAPLVIPTGRDVWRISRALEVPPWSFLIYFLSREPRRDAFVLDQSGRSFRLALAKGVTRRKKPPCIFLMRTRDGAHRCGLGELRPSVCRAFPTELLNGLVCVRPDTGCTCRDWSLADIDLTEERQLVEQRQTGAEEYCQVVEAWNARVEAAGPEAHFDFLDYCRFLMQAYDA
jgi:Fe-S-cluster containining protein